MVTAFPRAAGLIVILIGCLVLIGWQFDIVPLRSASSYFVTMKANAAFALALSGIALLLLTKSAQGRFVRIAIWTCILTVALTGLLTQKKGLTTLTSQTACKYAQFVAYLKP